MWEFFRFIKHFRERADSRRASEMAHQLALVDRLAGMIESLSEGQSKQIVEVTSALVEIARANQAQAEGFSTWLKSFQVTSNPTATVVRDEDEFREEQTRLFEDLGISTADMPEEFKLAFELQKGITDLGRGSAL